MIRYVDATRPGSSHDAFVWSISQAYDFFLVKYQRGHRGSWLLADSGYALQPFILTPYKDPRAGSVEHNFNLKHAAARNIIERVNGVLKSRFRCLQGCLHYTPLKASKIINVCSALHNICRRYKVQLTEELVLSNEAATIDDEETAAETINSTSLFDAGTTIRNDIAEALQRNR